MSARDTERRGDDKRGTRDLASVLPFAAIFLFLPPFVLTFTAPVALGGIPLIVLYIFGVWALVILCAAIVASRLAGAGARDQAFRRPDEPAKD